MYKKIFGLILIFTTSFAKAASPGCACTQTEIDNEMRLWNQIMIAAVYKSQLAFNQTQQRMGRGFVGNVTGYGPDCSTVYNTLEIEVQRVVQAGQFNFVCTTLANAFDWLKWLVATHTFAVVVDTCRYNVINQYDPWRTNNATPLPSNYQDVDAINPVAGTGLPKSPVGPFEPGYPPLLPTSPPTSPSKLPLGLGFTPR